MNLIKAVKFLAAAVVIFCIAIYAFFAEKPAYVYDWLGDGAYEYHAADSALDIGKVDGSKPSRVIVVSRPLINTYHIFEKTPGQEKISVYSNIGKDAYEQFLKTNVKLLENQYPKAEFRISRKISIIGERMGVATNPVRLEILDLLRFVAIPLSSPGSLLLLIVVLAFIYYKSEEVTVSTDCIRPEDITDRLDDLVGMADIKKELLQLEEMIKNRPLYQKYGAVKPFNVMMSGPSGVGKTKTARCLAQRINVPLFYASASSLHSGYKGGGSRALKKIYNEALKHDQAIIFLDEAEEILASRKSGKGEPGDNDALLTLLSLLDGVNTTKNCRVIWVVATNFNNSSMEMDDAMLRRFPLKIGFRLPNFHERKEILEKLVMSNPSVVASGNLNFEHLSTITAGMSPATLEEISSRAALIAIQEHSLITQDILIKSYERVVIGLTDRHTAGWADSKRHVVAIHESGHFVSQLHHAMTSCKGDIDQLQNHLNVLKISTESVANIGIAGFVLSQKTESKTIDLAGYEEQIIDLYSGMANEEAFYGSGGVTAGAHSDIDEVTNLLSMMFNEMGYYSHCKINYRTLYGNSDGYQRERQAELASRAEYLYSQALIIVEKYKELSQIISTHLMRHYVLTQKELMPIIIAYYQDRPSLVSNYKAGVRLTKA